MRNMRVGLSDDHLLSMGGGVGVMGASSTLGVSLSLSWSRVVKVVWRVPGEKMGLPTSLHHPRENLLGQSR